MLRGSVGRLGQGCQKCQKDQARDLRNVRKISRQVRQVREVRLGQVRNVRNISRQVRNVRKIGREVRLGGLGQVRQVRDVRKIRLGILGMLVGRLGQVCQKDWVVKVGRDWQGGSGLHLDAESFQSVWYHSTCGTQLSLRLVAILIVNQSSYVVYELVVNSCLLFVKSHQSQQQSICSQKLILGITRPKNNIFTSFFLEMGCPKHSLHAYIDIMWPG